MLRQISIDESLISEVLQLTGIPTEKEAVELALKNLITLHKQAKIRGDRGKLQGEGNLNNMREQRN